MMRSNGLNGLWCIGYQVFSPIGETLGPQSVMVHWALAFDQGIEYGPIVKMKPLNGIPIGV